jgi:hypothetical protein
VIFLTGFADETLEEAAIAAGAADFMQKSRGLSVLGRRIELAAEGRRPRSQPPLFRLGPLKLRFDTSRAFWRGSEIDLTLTEFRMVSKLALEAGQEVTYRELYDLVHGKDFVTGYNELGTLRTRAPPLSASGGNFRRSTLRSPASKPAKGTDTSGSINSADSRQRTRRYPRFGSSRPRLTCAPSRDAACRSHPAEPPTSSLSVSVR